MKFPRVAFCTALRYGVLGGESGGFTSHHPTRNPKVDPRTKDRFFGPPRAAFVLSEITESSLRFAILALLCKKPTHL